MNNKKLIETIRSLGLFIAGSTFNSYYVKILNAKEIREQAAKDLIKEKQMNVMSSTVSEIKVSADNYRTDMSSKLNTLEKQVDNLIRNTEKNKSDQILSQIKPELVKIKEKKEVLEKIVSGEANPENSSASVVNENLNELSGALDRINNVIESYDSSSSASSFISNFNFDKFYEFLDSLSFIQELAFLHIVLFIVLLCTVFNILAIFFSNEIIKYFKIENKFPSLKTFFKLRNTYQKYYLMWNISIMFIICLAAIYIDLLTFNINP